MGHTVYIYGAYGIHIWAYTIYIYGAYGIHIWGIYGIHIWGIQLNLIFGGHNIHTLHVLRYIHCTCYVIYIARVTLYTLHVLRYIHCTCYVIYNVLRYIQGVTIYTLHVDHRYS